MDLAQTMTVQELARRLRMDGVEVIKQLMRNGVMANLTQAVDYETAALIATDFGFQPSVETAEAPDKVGALHQEAVAAPAGDGQAPIPSRESPGLPGSTERDRSGTLSARPPVVTILGHVDHGKTTLLDRVRETRVAESEAGGITQHIGAYQVTVHGRPITFLDTPGHEAFTAMRARGARVTDIAVLVVAADDGVMPQTVEAIDHAKAAGVPIVVAINKIDRPNANPERVKTQLMEHDLVIEEFGGETIAVPVSAVTGEGVDLLLENLLLLADIAELKADPERLAAGVVIEAHVDRTRGPVATVLMQNGTLRVGDAVVAGETAGRVKALVDDQGRRMKEAGPSQPVEVLGLDGLAQAGDPLVAFAADREARALVQERRKESAAVGPSRGARAPILQEIYTPDSPTQMRELSLIIKTDVQGSVEALRTALERLSTGQARVRVLHAAAGTINESDILLATASRALVIGFNTRAEAGARALAAADGIEIRLYEVIYAAIDDVGKALTGILEPEHREVVDGHAEVRTVFSIGRRVKIAGCYVTDGLVNRNVLVRVLRGGELMGQGPVTSLRRFKDDAREVTAGLECGVAIEGFADFQEGDQLEFFHVETVAP